MILWGKNNNFEKQRTFKMKNIDKILFPLLMVLIVFNSFMTIFLPNSISMPYGFISGIISVGVLVTLLILRLFNRDFSSRPIWLSTLALITVNCFSLNKDVELFSPFSNWVYGYLAGMYVVLILFYIWNDPPYWLKLLSSFALGAGMVMALYFAICLLPLFPVGLFGMLAIGLGVHVFTPAILLVTLANYAITDDRDHLERIFIGAGIGLPIAIAVIFALNWNMTNLKIRQAHTEGLQNKDLPAWVNVAQHLPKDYLTTTLLTGDFKYDLFDANNIRDFGFNGGRRTIGDGRVHNPLVNMAHLLTGKTGLSEAERIKILKTTLGARHQTERKLWTGRDLSISKMDTEVNIHPNHRFAYTEKTFFIKNSARYKWETQEALFTFYLPEGSTATSLSLWINGKEEKSRLTTREKADSAYVQIVGRERRDPALLHWQEGNRLTLTVFPCSPISERQVKIGITSPLRFEDNKLEYQNIKIEGPLFNGKHNLQVRIMNDQEPKEKPRWLKYKDGKYLYKGTPKDSWTLSLTGIEVDQEPFSFNGNCYRIEHAKPKLNIFNPKQIYVDINQSWTQQEFEEIIDLFNGKVLFAFDQNLVQITAENQKEISSKLRQRTFSIFPLNRIQEPEQALLITKQGKGDLYLSDLDNGLEKKFRQWDQTQKALHVYCLGKETPGYLRQFSYNRQCLIYSTSVKGLKEWVNMHQFPDFQIRPYTTTIKESGVQIVKELNCTANSTAPDHLLRLYNYNNILERSQLGMEPKESLLNLANEAFVVSPISSLIVLESQGDYERFDIDINKRSLQNASTAGVGAVPEPQEWALIFLCLLTLLLAYKLQWFQ